MSIFNIVKSLDSFDLNRSYDFVNEDTYSVFPTNMNASIQSYSSFYARVAKKDDTYTITAELPGLSRGDINIEMKGSTLTIEANRDKDENMYTFKQHFKRSWSIPENAIEDSITAKYEAGVLRIDIPMRKEKIRKISVE